MGSTARSFNVRGGLIMKFKLLANEINDLVSLMTSNLLEYHGDEIVIVFC